jgi:AcrR family transcriptional regulator
VSSGGRPETRTQILEAARALFEELGYYGAGLEAVAKKAGVSRQAIYLHFPSKAELLTALHLHVFDTDVVPALRRHPITDAMSGLDVLDATIAVDVEIVARVWRIHESLTVARRQHPEVDQTLIPREEEHYEGLLDVGRRLERDGALPPTMPVGLFADMLWGLMNIGTYRNLVIERGCHRSSTGAGSATPSGCRSPPPDRPVRTRARRCPAPPVRRRRSSTCPV